MVFDHDITLIGIARNNITAFDLVAGPDAQTEWLFYIYINNQFRQSKKLTYLTTCPLPIQEF